MRRNPLMVVLAVVVGAFVVSPWAWAEQVAVTAPQQAITVDGNENVGIGPTAAETRLHISEAAGDTNGSNVTITLQNTTTGSKWLLQAIEGNTDHFVINKLGTGVQEIRLDAGGNVTINGDLTVLGNLSCANDPTLVCDRAFQPDYPLLSIEEHSAAMFENSYLPVVGPTPDEDPGPMQIGDKMLRILNELEVAHIYIDQLNNRLKTEERKAAFLDKHFVAGRFLDASSRDLKLNVDEINAEEAIGTVLALSPVRFAYREDPTEEHLGFIAEDVPALVATADRKTLSAMDVVAVLTKTVQEQQRLLSEKDARLDVLEQRMARLEEMSSPSLGKSPVKPPD